MRGNLGRMTSPTPSDSAEQYRARARQVRELARTIRSPSERDALFDIAEKYERLADARPKG
jgi:hypothetical protein